MRQGHLWCGSINEPALYTPSNPLVLNHTFNEHTENVYGVSYCRHGAWTSTWLHHIQLRGIAYWNPTCMSTIIMQFINCDYLIFWIWSPVHICIYVSSNQFPNCVDIGSCMRQCCIANSFAGSFVSIIIWLAQQTLTYSYIITYLRRICLRFAMPTHCRYNAKGISFMICEKWKFSLRTTCL